VAPKKQKPNTPSAPGFEPKIIDVPEPEPGSKGDKEAWLIFMGPGQAKRERKKRGLPDPTDGS
jgi:hypothetical protein